MLLGNETPATEEDDRRSSEIRLRQMYQLARDLGAVVTLEEVARTVCVVAPAVADCRAAVLGLSEDLLLPGLAKAERSGGSAVPWIDLARDELGVLREAAVGKYSQSLQGYDQSADGDHRAIFVRLRGAANEVIGVLALVMDPHEGLPSATHLESVATQIGQALVRAALFEREHRLAQRLQMSLLPELASHDAIQVAARYSPGSDLVAVGGDWYDLFPLPDGRIGLAIGDVAGHGLAEAAIMAQLRNALRAFALKGESPGPVLTQMDRFLCTYVPTRTATLCYLVFDPQVGSLEWANAGHLPPLLVRSDGELTFLTEHSFLLGTGIERKRATEATNVSPGSTLLLYTDGLVERRHEVLDEGLRFLAELASEVYELEPDMLCRILVDHREKEPHPDDRALMVVRFLHTSESR